MRALKRGDDFITRL